MLEDLLKHNKIGNKDEILFFLFDGLPSSGLYALKDIQKFCISNIFTISQSFWGIVKLCEFILFVEVIGEQIRINKQYFDPEIFQKKSYFNEFHFYDHLLRALEKQGIIKDIFNEDNIRFNANMNQYYILDTKLSYKYFPIRNILLSMGLFNRKAEFVNQLLINQQFTENFKKTIIKKMLSEKNKSGRMTLDQLRKSIENKEKAGKEAELKALEYEYQRLKGHPDIEKVCLISDEFNNAGYDIESFENNDSILIDRFIEVKSFMGGISFYWSENEVEKAKELEEKYYIYLIDRSEFNNEICQPKKFQNPYKKIFENELWLKETKTWKMTLDDSDIK